MTEDPDAPRRVQAIMAHANYRQADRDVDFLDQDATRSARLEIDYLNAELVLLQHAV